MQDYKPSIIYIDQEVQNEPVTMRILQKFPDVERKVIADRKEIKKLIGKSIRRGFTIVPLSLYFKQGRVKVEIALARGKQVHDKREKARRKAIDRDVQMELKRRR